jgi:hypothetical protein
MAAKKKSSAAVALGKRGAKARMTKMTAEERSNVAHSAAMARWSKLTPEERSAAGQRSVKTREAKRKAPRKKKEGADTKVEGRP